MLTLKATEKTVKPGPHHESHVIEMVGHAVLHAEGVWCCRVCDDLPKFSLEGAVAHLSGSHGFKAGSIIVDAQEGALFVPCPGETA